MNEQVKQICTKIERKIKMMERNIASLGDGGASISIATYQDVLNIIDSLSDEQPSNLEEVAEEYASKYPAYNNEQDITKDAFLSGAKWQKKQDTADMLKSDFTVFNKCYEQGKKDMKEQIMKDAVEVPLYRNGDFFASIDIDMATLGYPDEDKVKIIIVKEGE